jgi:cation transport ATPase
MSATAPPESETVAAAASAQGREALIVEGMHCASCAARVERVLSRKPGVHAVEVNYATHHAELTNDPVSSIWMRPARRSRSSGIRSGRSRVRRRRRPTRSTTVPCATGCVARG